MQPPCCDSSRRCQDYREAICFAALDVESRVLEIEIALEAVHDLLRDAAFVAQRDDRASLGVEQLASRTLILQRLLLDRAVVAVVEPRAKAPLPELVRAAQPLGRVGAHRAVVDELVEPAIAASAA